MNRHAERGGVGWYIHAEGAVVVYRNWLAHTIDDHRHRCSIEINVFGGGVARQRQGHGGRCRARVAQSDVKRGAVAFRHGWAADALNTWAIVVWRAIRWRHAAVVFDGRGTDSGCGLRLSLSAQCEAFAPFIYVIIGGLNRDAERSITSWDRHFEGTITIDVHGLCGAILISDGHFGTGEVCACSRAATRQCQSDGGRCCAGVAQANVKRSAVPF
ncbi:hypothetical protein VCSRO141_3267 [Vibrio cholerae]|nr:hypothetical protein VCSRO141_3267 [Vibrio cholerae]